ELPACGVDDPHAVAHPLDRRRVDRAARLLGERQVEREEVGARKHLVERPAFDAELAEAIRRDERVVRQHLHLEGERTAGDEAADAPETEHAERLVGELDAAPLGALPAAVAERGVRLRDVPCERQQQAERVLGGRQGVRLGRVGDDDAAARRRVDVDVVDADTGAADHLQVRRRGDHLRGDLRRRPDDQRVVAADDLVERRVEVDVDVELRAQQLDARVGDPLANENLHGQAATGLSNASNARGTAAPRSMSAPSSVSDSSIAARALAMSKTSNQPMWPIRKTLPLRWAWPGASVTPWRSRRWSRSVS